MILLVLFMLKGDTPAKSRILDTDLIFRADALAFVNAYEYIQA